MRRASAHVLTNMVSLVGLIWVLGSRPAHSLAGGPAVTRSIHQELTPLPVRVIQSSPGGLLEIDRGELDGLRVGDRVVLTPRGLGNLDGRVLEVGERTAAVELLGSSAALPSGTRGEAWIPLERLTPKGEIPAEQLAHQLLDAWTELEILLLIAFGHWSGNNQWGTRIIDQYTIHLIHHREMVFALHHLIF